MGLVLTNCELQAWRVVAGEKSHNTMGDVVPSIAATCNNQKATGKTPAEAREPSHKAEIQISMGLRATRGNVFPTLEARDKVRALGKKRLCEKNIRR
jgi:hypothetical protein